MNNKITTQKGIAPLVIILIIVGVLVAAGGVWYFTKKPQNHITNSCPTAPRVCADGTKINLAQPNCDETCPEDQTADWKNYRNEKYDYSLKYPNEWFAFEWPGNYRGEKPVLIDLVGNKDSTLFSQYDLRNDAYDSGEYLSHKWVRVTRENGEAWVKGSQTVDDFWSKLSKVDEKGNEVNRFSHKEKIDGIEFLFFDQYGWDLTIQGYAWSPQALFMYNGNFFWVRPSTHLKTEEFNSFLHSFKFAK